MWIEQLPNGKYKYVERYTNLNGKVKRVSAVHEKQTASAKKEMTALLQKKIERALMPEKIKYTITFAELADKWLEVHKQKIKVSTLNNILHRLTHLKKQFGDVIANDITYGEVNNYLLTLLTEKGIRFGTASHYKATFCQILEHGIKFGYVINDIRSRIYMEKLNLSQTNDFKYLEEDELKQVISFFDKPKTQETKRLIIILSGTGLRFGELMALNYSTGIDFDNNTLHIRQNYDYQNHLFTTTKTGKERTIYANDNVMKAIKEQIIADKLKVVRYNLNKEDTYLFRNKLGKPFIISRFNFNLKKVNVKGKRLTAHIFRHTFISLAIEKGVSKDLIAKQVGHTDTKMIDKVYAHFTKNLQEQQKKAMLDLNIV